MGVMDPLDAFRAAISAKYEIEPVNASGTSIGSLRSATHLRFSTAITLPKNAPTRLRKVGSNAKAPASEPDGFFMLEAVYLAWSLRDTPGGEYMKQAREHGLPAGGFVGLTERKSIVDWLKRSVAALDSIVPLSGVFSYLSKVYQYHPTANELRVDHTPGISPAFCLPSPACSALFYPSPPSIALHVCPLSWRHRPNRVAS